MSLGTLYIAVFSLGIWGEFRITFCCSTGEKVEPQRAQRERAGDQKVPYLRGRCVPRKNEKQEWVMWSREKVTGSERHSSQRDKTFLSSAAASGCLPSSHNATLYHHFWRVPWQPAPGYTAPNGISGKLVTMAISCDCSQPSDSFFALSEPPLPHSTAITLPVIICYYITQTAPGHQSHTEHTQNALIIVADRAISPLMISLTHTLNLRLIPHCTLLKGLQTKHPPPFPFCLHQHSIRPPLPANGGPVSLLWLHSAGGPASADTDVTWQPG